MSGIVPGLIVAAVYLVFKSKTTKGAFQKKFYWEALAFGVVTYGVMTAYRRYMGFEGMSTFGDVCPDGYSMVKDPVNAQQTTCVPVGHPTYNPTTGFGAIAAEK